jgi:hypothetical protein
MIKYFNQLLLWLWPVNEMIELVSGLPAPEFEDESFWLQGSELVQGSDDSERRFRVPPKMSSRTLSGMHTPGWIPLL